jgi:mono/diheme cytochrome c family protein
LGIALLCSAFVHAIPVSIDSPVNPVLVIHNTPVPLSALKKKFTAVQVRVQNHPVYEGGTKTYTAFPMRPLLDHFWSIDPKHIHPNQVVFIETDDGYVSKIPLSAFYEKQQGYLAFQETFTQNTAAAKSKDGKWSLVNMNGKMVSPGPFYIVWDTVKDYPVGWPFQIRSIALVNWDESQYTKLLKPKSTVAALQQGYQLFQSNCSSCHSLYYQGASGRAPDLALVTRYRESKEIHAIIQKGRGAMPPVPKVLSEQEQEALMAYLKWVSSIASDLELQRRNN